MALGEELLTIDGFDEGITSGWSEGIEDEGALGLPDFILVGVSLSIVDG